jgi:hypothetical protein
VADDVEAIVATFRLLDSDTYEQAIEFVDDEFEMVTTPDLASEPDVYRGPEGVRRWWESFLPVNARAGSRPISARLGSPPLATASCTG